MTSPSFADMAQLAYPVSVDLVTPFRGISTREAIIFDSPAGPSEWSPFLEYEDPEATTWLRSTLEQGWREEAADDAPQAPASLVVNGTIPALSPSDIADFVVGLGIPHTVKVKVGGVGSTRALDVARVKAVRDILGPSGRIRLDANGSWSLDEAEHAIREMESFDIDYVEQPVASVEDLAELRRRITRLGIQVAADESIRRSSDLNRVLAEEAADIAVMKVQPLGGIERAVELAQAANALGVSVVVSSALETSVGLYYGVMLHQRLVNLGLNPLDPGLGTASLLAADVVQIPLLATAGVLSVTPPVLDTTALAQHALPPERADWWLARLERCHSGL
jgi:o-succinylbenzoate synthase